MSTSPSPEPSTTASTKEEKTRSTSSEASQSRSASQDGDDKDSQSRSASPSRPDHAAPSTSKASNDNDIPDVPVTTNAHTNGDWQAIWSPQHNAYYFYNLRTNETTWTNPLATTADANTAASSARYNAEAAALAQGIDPALAYLDPSLAAGPSNPAAFTYAAKFNARTGAFAKPDARNPEHVSEYERMKRMSQFYFDVDEWQQQLEKQQEEEETGKKRKKPTKKDLVSWEYVACLSPLAHERVAGVVQGEEEAEEIGKDGLVAYIVPSFKSNLVKCLVHVSAPCYIRAI